MTDIATLQTQQADTVIALRKLLQGDWDGARMEIDAIDPSNSGKWSNVSFPQRITGPSITQSAELVLHQFVSGNYWPGRPHGPPIALVIHTEAGSEAGTESEFTNNAAQVSAHFGVGLDGRIDQFVALTDTAWANGIFEPGNNWDAKGLPNRNPNYLTVSCETEDRGDPAQPVTNAQYAGVLGVGRLALATYPSIRYLLAHRDISPSSRAHCCGARWWDSGRFADLATALGLQTIS